MPRLFKPVKGFAGGGVTAIKIDDEGMSHEVLEDGTERLVAYHDWGNAHRPIWAISELANLVKSGEWEEIQQTPDAPLKPNTPGVTTVASSIGATASVRPIAPKEHDTKQE